MEAVRLPAAQEKISALSRWSGQVGPGAGLMPSRASGITEVIPHESINSRLDAVSSGVINFSAKEGEMNPARCQRSPGYCRASKASALIAGRSSRFARHLPGDKIGRALIGEKHSTCTAMPEADGTRQAPGPECIAVDEDIVA